VESGEGNLSGSEASFSVGESSECCGNRRNRRPCRFLPPNSCHQTIKALTAKIAIEEYWILSSQSRSSPAW
jgi:hypothetical protein